MQLKSFFLLYLSAIIFLFSCEGLSVFEAEQELLQGFSNSINQNSDTILAHSTIRVLSWNIQIGCKNGDNPFKESVICGKPDHLEQVGNVINSYNPDIVILQEVGNEISNSVISDQAFFLAQKLLMNYSYCEYGEINSGKNIFLRGRRSLTTFVKGKINSISVKDMLYKGRFERRRFLATEVILSDGTPLVIYNIHIANHSNREEKFYQSDIILSDLNKTKINIIGGDFNMIETDDYFNYFLDYDLSNPLNVLDTECSFKVFWKGTLGNIETGFRGPALDHFLYDNTSVKPINLCLSDSLDWNLSNHKLLFFDFTLN